MEDKKKEEHNHHHSDIDVDGEEKIGPDGKNANSIILSQKDKDEEELIKEKADYHNMMCYKERYLDDDKWGDMFEKSK